MIAFNLYNPESVAVIIVVWGVFHILRCFISSITNQIMVLRYYYWLWLICVCFREWLGRLMCLKCLRYYIYLSSPTFCSSIIVLNLSFCTICAKRPIFIWSTESCESRGARGCPCWRYHVYTRLLLQPSVRGAVNGHMGHKKAGVLHWSRMRDVSQKPFREHFMSLSRDFCYQVNEDSRTSALLWR